MLLVLFVLLPIVVDKPAQGHEIIKQTHLPRPNPGPYPSLSRQQGRFFG